MEVYLDNAATTKPSEEVIAAMMKALRELYGNPSSLHRKGVEVEREIKKIRRLIAKTLGSNEKGIIFTSSGTEANNLAIRGLIKAYNRNGNHIITSKIEHKSILNLYKELEQEGYKVTYLDVDKRGFISLEQLKESISEETILVSVMHVNNEIGSIQPIKSISQIIKEKNPNTRFHVDAVQSFGKLKFSMSNLGADTLAISGHKIHGPKGVATLSIKDGVRIAPMLVGGGQEMELRAGTENVPGIFGMGEAVRLLIEKNDEYINKMQMLKNYLVSLIENELEDIKIHSEISDDFAPHIVNVSLLGVRSEIMLHSLETDGIFVSSGSACSSKRKGYSHVLKAMNMKEEYMDSAIRISLSHSNTKEELDYSILKMKEHLKSLRKIIRR